VPTVSLGDGAEAGGHELEAVSSYIDYFMSDRPRKCFKEADEAHKIVHEVLVSAEHTLMEMSQHTLEQLQYMHHDPDEEEEEEEGEGSYELTEREGTTVNPAAGTTN